MKIVENPRFIDAMRTSISRDPVEFDSETAIARHITKHATIAARDIGLSDTEIISTDGFLWQYTLTDGTWYRVETDNFMTLAQLYDGTFPSGGSKPRRIQTGHQRTANMARSALRLHEIQKPGFFESPRKGMACTSGFIEVTRDEVKRTPHSPENRATISYDLDLDPAAPPPVKWLAFLDSLWAEDEDKAEKIAVLQEFLGASMTNLATEYQKCLLFLGTGSNGKSVLCELISELLFPEGTVTYISPRKWEKEYSLAALKDSLINIVSELPETHALESTDVFKAVVAGDMLEARLPYQAPHFIRPSAGHIFSANEIPRTGDVSHGFFRRFETIGFNVNFAEPTGDDDSGDSPRPVRRTKADIMADLMPERAAIIVWCLQGTPRLIARGAYTSVASHAKNMAGWRQDSDAVFDFASSCLDTSGGEKTSLSQIYEEYLDWAPSVGRKGVISRNKMSSRLAQLEGMVKKKTSSGVVFHCRIRLRGERDLHAN